MNKTFSWALKILPVLAVVFLTACDDGELRVRKQNFSITPASPVIVKFDADPNQILAGESSTITWEVSGADAIEITSVGKDGSSPIHVETKEAAGTVVAKNLTADTDFIITATVAAGAEAEDDVVPKGISISAYPPKGEDVAIGGKVEDPSGSSTALPSTKTITVKVVSAEEVSAMITADKATLAEGESTIIRWSVTPEDATVEVIDDQGVAAAPTYAGDDCLISDPDELLDRGTPTEAVPAKGCSVASPLENSVYTVTGTSKGGETGSADVKIAVAPSRIAADITVNDVKEARVTNFSEPVTVAWTSEPVGAPVKITANPPVESCTPELPDGQVVEYTSASCVVSAPTEFSISVETPSGSAEDTAKLSKSEVAADIDIRSDEWAFEGEEISISIQPKEGTETSAIKEIQISDRRESSGIKRVTMPVATPIKVVVPMDGVRIKMINSADEETDYGTRVRALTTIAEEVAADAEAITAMIFDPANVTDRFVGIQMPGWNGGVARIYKNGGERNVNFGSEMIGDLKDYLQVDTIEAKQIKFPVNAIALRSDPKQIFAGTSGAVMVSDDDGMTFKLLATLFRISKDGKDYQGSHPTCRGMTQNGVKASHKKQLVSFNQVCDIAIGSNGRFIIASDNGTFMLSDVDAYMADSPDVSFVGRPTDESKAAEEGMLAYKHVVDDLECVDANCDKVFAATDSGVLVSENGGATWAEFGSLGHKAFKLLRMGEKLYAATEGGVYETDISSASWNSMGLSESTKSLAIDPNESASGHRMLMAGTDSGVYVTRDSGATWSVIDAAGSEASKAVAISAMAAKSGSGKLVTVMMGSGKTAVYGQTTVNMISSSATASEEADAMLSAGADERIVEALKTKASK